MQPIRPILRWAGSKRLMLPKLLSLAPTNYQRYIEPFCGSACYFLALKPKRAILADLNHQLISTYAEIKARPINVAQSMKDWTGTKEEYLYARSHPVLDPIASAGRFLFLNRYSFNGVYRENRKGEFNVPFGGQRNGQLPTVQSLEAFASALSGAQLVCSDFENIINRAKAGDFLYLDPPYHYGTSRNRGEYGYGAFSSDDLGRFIEAVNRASQRGAQILISYNKAHALQRELQGWKLAYCTVRRSVAGFSASRHSIREYLLRNY